MALTGKKYESFYLTTGGGADEIDAKKLTNVTNAWATEKAEGCQKYLDDPIIAPLIYQLQQMQDELDYLITEIETNKDKTTFPGLGTSSTTALAGDTALLTLGTSGTTALAGDTKLVGIGSNTTLSFGDLTSTTVKGVTTYSIVMTATRDFGGKVGSQTKSITLTLT